MVLPLRSQPEGTDRKRSLPLRLDLDQLNGAAQAVGHDLEVEATNRVRAAAQLADPVGRRSAGARYPTVPTVKPSTGRQRGKIGYAAASKAVGQAIDWS